MADSDARFPRDPGSIRGMLDVATLKDLVSKDEIDTVLAVFPDMYGRLMGKRIIGDYFVTDVLDGEIHACDYLLASDMEMDPVPGYSYTNLAKGYGDFRLIPDLSTLRKADWLDGTAIVLCDVHQEDSDLLVNVAPRSVLRNQVDRAEAMGYTAKGASELEFYLFKDSYADAGQKNYMGLEPHSAYIEDYQIFQGGKEEYVVGAIRRHVDRSGVPVEFSKGEWGPGQQEINLRYTDFFGDGRQARYLQARRERDSLAEGPLDHVYGQMGRAPRRFEHAHSREPLERGSGSFLRKQRRR